MELTIKISPLERAMLPMWKLHHQLVFKLNVICKKVNAVVIFSIILAAAIIVLVKFALLYLKEKHNYDLLKQKYDALLENQTNNQAGLQKIIEEFKQNMEAMGAKIAQQNREISLAESKQSLTALIDPLQKNINEFKEKIDKSHIEDTKNRTELKISLEEQIKNVMNATKNIGNQADSLANALKGDKKMQGNWGERILKDILDNSGLQEGISYYSQGLDLKLVDEDGIILRPDFIVNLANDQSVIIDAKVSIINYEKYSNSSSEDERQQALKNFATDVKNHIDILSSKDYQKLTSNTQSLNILGSVMLFIPIESTYYEVLRYEKGELHDYAWKKGIVIVGPYNLMPILKVIDHLSKIEKQNKNAQEIAKAGGALYDKFVSLLEGIIKFKKGFESLGKNFDEEVVKKLDGKGNLINRAEKMKSMGIKSDKQIPIFFDENKENEIEFSLLD